MQNQQQEPQVRQNKKPNGGRAYVWMTRTIGACVIVWMLSDFQWRWTGRVYAHAASFKFDAGKTPLAAVHVPFIAVAIYLATTLYALPRLVQWRGKPYDLQWLVGPYNFVLAFVSLVLWTLLAHELGTRVNQTSLWEVACDPDQKQIRGWIVFLYYLNYLCKYVELVDTVLLALRAKPMKFLHVYHHAATLLLCWHQLSSETCVQWVVIWLNLAVHIVMYTYYGLSSLGHEVWWKRYLTQMQIIQFVIDIAVGIRMLIYQEGTARQGNGPMCHGDFSSAWFAMFLLLSYLLLFIRMYKQTYDAKRRSIKPVKAE